MALPACGPAAQLQEPGTNADGKAVALGVIRWVKQDAREALPVQLRQVVDLCGSRGPPFWLECQ